jgi:hypothetical protein
MSEHQISCSAQGLMVSRRGPKQDVISRCCYLGSCALQYFDFVLRFDKETPIFQLTPFGDVSFQSYDLLLGCRHEWIQNVPMALSDAVELLLGLH